MTRKLLTLVVLIVLAGPALACLCFPAEVDCVMVCSVEDPVACCCEGEVLTPALPGVPDFVSPATVNVPTLVPAMIPVAESQVFVRSTVSDRTPAKSNDPSHQDRYLIHQSFLI